MLCCQINYPFKISAEAGIQESSDWNVSLFEICPNIPVFHHSIRPGLVFFVSLLLLKSHFGRGCL